jgi:tripartite-type tricarboxylate transporter receptor subunit TctC
MRSSILTSALAAIAIQSGGAQAQPGGYRLMVGVQAGASTDTIARLIAEKMRVSLNEPVVVENRPGAGQRVAMGELLKSPADGRTMLLSASALYSIVPHIYGDKAGFDPMKDVIPVSRVVAFQVGVGAATQIGATNIKEFIAWAQANPNKASYGSPGPGTSSHLTGILLSKAIGIPMVHVPYRGGAPMIADLTAGHIPLMFTSISDYPEHAKAGKLRILASAGPNRSPAAPDVPTLREQGIDIAFEAGFDLHVRAGVPQDMVKRIHAAVAKAVREPDVSSKLETMGVQPRGSTPDELYTQQAAELKFWEEPVKASGYKGE